MVFLLTKMMFTNHILMKCHFSVPARFPEKNFNNKLTIADCKVIFIIKFFSGSELYFARINSSVRGKVFKKACYK